MDNNVMICNADVLKERIEVLRYFDNSFISKIPVNFLKLMKESSINSKLEVKIDSTKSLSEQDISEECKDMISLIYYHYIATEDERVELIEIWKNNEELYQKLLREKYNPDNVFNKQNNEIKQNEHSVENIPVVIKEKNIFQKIMDFIKNIFKNK